MRAIWLPFLALAAGCTAIHKISLESDPPGAHIEYNGSYLGATPVEYEIISPYAEKIWPADATLTARMSGWQGVTRSYVFRDELPERVVFVLQPLGPEPEPSGAPDDGDASDAASEIEDEYETLEEQKSRFSGGQDER